MTTFALVVDERELSTIQAALLLLQEQINGLPEDLAEMMIEHGRPLTETEIGELAQRTAVCHRPFASLLDRDLPRAETLVEIERAAPALALK
jgi:hypothetical protein